jgi:iron complex outermembrane receptor protein
MTSPSHPRVGVARYLRTPVLLLLGLGLAVLGFAAEAAKKNFNVPANDAAKALKQFAAQSGEQLLFSPSDVAGVKTLAIKGSLTARAALEQMLEGTALVVAQDKSTGALAVRKETAAESKNGASRPAEREAASGAEAPSAETGGAKIKDGTVQLETFEVMGTRLINADLPRDRDGTRPYVVFDHSQVESSMAPNLEEFLRSRLPMNQVQQQESVNAAAGASQRSAINLRGLGTNQTLVLVDGRRMPSIASGFTLGQSDINGIPMSMVERIEILPSSASGIYGGGATGGVINIITRKDYSGVQVTYDYANTFDTDASTRRVDLNGSFSLEGGRTHLTITYSRTTGTALTLGDRRDLASRGLTRLLAHNPGTIYNNPVPPVGYTTNIRAANGSNLVLKNGTALNSPFTFVPVGYSGVASDAGAALAANAGKYNLDLPQTPNLGALTGIRSVPDTESFSVNVRRSWGAALETFVDFSSLQNTGEGLYGGVPNTSFTLPATAPNNPFTTPIRVVFPATNLAAYSVNESETLRAMAGVVMRLPGEWRASADYVWGRSTVSNAFPTTFVGDPDGTGPGISFNTAVANGTLDVMRDLNVQPLNYTPYLMPDPNFYSHPREMESSNATLRGTGPLWQLPAGALLLAGNVEWRRQEGGASLASQPSATGQTRTYSLILPVSQTAKSGYLEAHIPLASERGGWRWAHELEIEAAVRRDEYSSELPALSTAFTATSPDGPWPAIPAYRTVKSNASKSTVGLRYAPVKDVALRVSWGDGFLTPNLASMLPSTPFTTTLTVVDPKRSGVAAPAGPATLGAGGNPNLRPELSESVSAGVIFTPRFLPGFRLSVDYTHITKTDEVTSLTFQQQLDFEDYFPGMIGRAALTDADRALGYTGGAITAFNSGTVNLARKEVTAYDIQLDYTRKTAALGEFRLYALATYQPDFSSQPIPGAPVFNSAGYNTLLEWRGNGGLEWSRGRWSAGWNMQYYHSYLGYSPTATAATIATFITNQGTDTIPSQVYHDVRLRYRFGPQPSGWRRLLANTELTIGMQNVLNDEPPAIASAVAFLSSYSTYGDARLRRYNITVRKQF